MPQPSDPAAEAFLYVLPKLSPDEVAGVVAKKLEPHDYGVIVAPVSNVQAAIATHPETKQRMTVLALQVLVPYEILPIASSGAGLIDPTTGQTALTAKVAALFPTPPVARVVVQRAALSKEAQDHLIAQDIAANQGPKLNLDMWTKTENDEQ